MQRVAVLGVLVTVLALILKREKGEYAVAVEIAAGILIFVLVLAQVETVADFLQELAGRLPIEDGYLSVLFKILGITYIAEFSSAICKDAGHSSLAGQIELFAKLSILALSIPQVAGILDLLDRFLA